MKFLIPALLLTAIPALADTVACKDGFNGRDGYQKITVVSGQAIGAKGTVKVEQMVRLGRNRLTMITTELEGKVIPDQRPMMRPDPATIIQLIGRDEVGKPTDYGTLYIRPSLGQPESMQIQGSLNNDTNVNCL